MIFNTADPLRSFSVPYLGTFSLPATDTELLKGLQQPEVHRWTLVRIKECEEYLRTLRSVHNSAAPINASLPVELITRIFLDIEVDSLQDIVVMHVCRAWRAILLSTPEFFANLLGVMKEIEDYPQADNGALCTLLRLSGTRELTVHEPRFQDIHLDTGLLVPHLNRIRSLTVVLSVPEFLVFHQLLKSGAMPVLADLVVGYWVWQPWSKEDDLRRLVPWTEEDVPSLRHLELPGRLFARAAAYAPLLSLTLKHVKTEANTDIVECPSLRIELPGRFLKVLSRCTRLRILDLWNALPTRRASWDAIHRSFPAIDFPELRELRIHENRPHLLSSFLSHITFPATASLMLHGGDTMFSNLLPLRHRETLLGSPTALHFSSPREGSRLKVSTLRVRREPEGQTSLELQVRTSDELLARDYTESLLADLKTLFPSSIDISELELGCSWARFHEFNTGMLDSFPHTKRLTLIQRAREGSKHVLESVLTAPSSGLGRFVCPMLEELVIEGKIPPAADLAPCLLEIMQTRGQSRLKSLRVIWPWSPDQTQEMRQAQALLEVTLANFVDRVCID
ncbi:hypothetical protein LXA43DRAFT_94818 [Ganoderma leucocontextum]|nr:hypothetical protein LXA43DRAFT_94818 [Ganoderma leucocontextum]